MENNIADGQVKIIVMDRGHIVVARIYRHPGLAFHWLLCPSRVIRRWGTSEGLAQLATSGPQKGTIIEPPITESVPFRGVIRIIDCKESVWKDHLKKNYN